jgi:hypothetical protein
MKKLLAGSYAPPPPQEAQKLVSQCLETGEIPPQHANERGAQFLKSQAPFVLWSLRTDILWPASSEVTSVMKFWLRLLDITSNLITDGKARNQELQFFITTPG